MRSETIAVIVALSAALILMTAVLVTAIRMPPASEVSLDISAKEGKARFIIKSFK